MPVIESRVLARRTLSDDGVVLSVESDGHSGLLPFQFYMLSVPGDEAFPFLPRPFSVYDSGERSLDFLVKVVGDGTASLARLQLGDELLLTGPLGNGVAALPVGRRSIGVAGGVGIAPFLLLYRRWLQQAGSSDGVPPVLIYGARNAELLWDLELFRDLPVDLRIATEDGSVGTKGRVTDLLEEVLAEDAGSQADVLCCGPDPMMEAVAELCAGRQVPCRLSLETYMACGFGVCNACAVRVVDERYREGFRYDRCCVEGPVFDAATIEL